jgi:hypothetical protein
LNLMLAIKRTGCKICVKRKISRTSWLARHGEHETKDNFRLFWKTGEMSKICNGCKGGTDTIKYSRKVLDSVV